MLLVKTHPVARGIKIGSNQPPVWQSSPSPSFTLGTASNFPPSGTYQSNNYVTDANSDPITITWLTGSVTGVTWDGGKFVYGGAGSVGTTGSLVLRATDGVDHADSSAFSIEIASGLAWSATPSISFVEAGTTATNLGVYVTNYNATTDEFRVTPGYSLPSWLSLTPGPGAGSGNLTPNGTQLDANDIPANPGIKIDVRRSGGAWVSSPAFGVTVYVAGSGMATWKSMALVSVAANKDNSANAPHMSAGNFVRGPFSNTALPRLSASMAGDGTPDTQAAWDAWAARAKDQSAAEWVNMDNPPWGGWTMYPVNHDFHIVYFVPG